MSLYISKYYPAALFTKRIYLPICIFQSILLPRSYILLRTFNSLPKKKKKQAKKIKQIIFLFHLISFLFFVFP